MELSFTTLGCLECDLHAICAKGRDYGYDGVDFRGLQRTMDITQLPAFTSGIAQAWQQLHDSGLEVSGISSSIRVCVPEKLQDNVEEARRSIPMAKELGCEAIRVFGAGDSAAHSKEALADIGRDTTEQILSLDGASDLKWLCQTHDEWIKRWSASFRSTRFSKKLSECSGIWAIRRKSARSRRNKPGRRWGRGWRIPT